MTGLRGKPEGLAGGTWRGIAAKGLAEVAAYGETDVVNTYRAWLRYELFRGWLTENGLRASEASLTGYIRSHSNTKPHLVQVQVEKQQVKPGEHPSISALLRKRPKWCGAVIEVMCHFRTHATQQLLPGFRLFRFLIA